MSRAKNEHLRDQLLAADRDTLAALISANGGATHSNREMADAILASDWLAARDRRVAAQTLRDAKAAIHAKDGNPPWYFLKGRAFIYVEDLYRTLDALRADTTEGTHHD